MSRSTLTFACGMIGCAPASGLGPRHRLAGGRRGCAGGPASRGGACCTFSNRPGASGRGPLQVPQAPHQAARPLHACRAPDQAARPPRARRPQVEAGYRASAGVACNRMLAKLAAGLHKPDDQTVLLPSEAAAFVAGLPARGPRPACLPPPRLGPRAPPARPALRAPSWPGRKLSSQSTPM
jgi:hypothetical protein